MQERMTWRGSCLLSSLHWLQVNLWKRNQLDIPGWCFQNHLIKHPSLQIVGKESSAQELQKWWKMLITTSQINMIDVYLEDVVYLWLQLDNEILRKPMVLIFLVKHGSHFHEVTYHIHFKVKIDCDTIAIPWCYTMNYFREVSYLNPTMFKGYLWN